MNRSYFIQVFPFLSALIYYLFLLLQYCEKSLHVYPYELMHMYQRLLAQRSPPLMFHYTLPEYPPPHLPMTTIFCHISLTWDVNLFFLTKLLYKKVVSRCDWMYIIVYELEHFLYVYLAFSFLVWNFCSNPALDWFPKNKAWGKAEVKCSMREQQDKTEKDEWCTTTKLTEFHEEVQLAFQCTGNL
jgi:hypothetical protein